MSYAELYRYCQNLPTPISRAAVIPKVVELTRRPRKPLILIRSMDPAHLAGFIVFPGPDANPDHPIVRWGRGEPVIFVARPLNYCWRRFVVIKELMHYFDPPLARVSTESDFEALVTEFSAPQLDRSRAMDCEVRALWMALGIICPEEQRQQMERQRLVGAIDDATIAERLKMPLAYVPLLFHTHFKEIIAGLCAC